MNQPETAKFIGHEQSFQMALFHVRFFRWRFIIVCDHQPLIFHCGRIEIGLSDCVAWYARWVIDGTLR